MQQTPNTDDFLLKWRGDELTVTLTLNMPRKGRAAFRTNIGNASVRRQEIIAQTEHAITPLAKAWHDIPMQEVSHGVYRCTISLNEVGIFSGKACFFPEGSKTPEWPNGQNLHVKVEPAHLRKANSIYTVFVRQFGAAMKNEIRTDDVKAREAYLDEKGYTVIPPSGTFRNVVRHLDTIMDEMKFRIVQVLPIFPVPTTFARMGRYGSAFAATDFLSVDPACAEFDENASPLDQFVELIDAVHAKGGLLFVDLPANHTGWAATLQTHHPNWYHREKGGKFISPGAWGVTWADLVELDYKSPELRAYMADVFLFWCRRGVDGFRCDAGYMIPEETWTYIVARVREEYPDTVFMLEGLGGKLEVTDALLARSGLDWAYSEIFQTEDRSAFEWYLPGAIARAEKYGSLVHFAETHDNDRLEKRGKVWARMRVMISALLSHQGAWGIANGVEWYCTEKIDVHGALPLNWGAQDNMLSLIARLNTILDKHPAFNSGTHVELITRGGGNCLAAVRTCSDEKFSLLILANLDCNNACNVTWDVSKFAAVNVVDLVAEKPMKIAADAGVNLNPGEVLCLAHAHASMFPVAVKDNAVKGEAIEGTVVTWKWPEDTRRDVPVPAGARLRVKAPYPFRVCVKDGERTICAERSENNSAVLSLPSYQGDGTRANMREIKLAVYTPEGVKRSSSKVCILPKGGEAKVKLSMTGAQVREDSTLKTVLSNGAGADAQVCAAWGEIASQYDSLLSANTNPDVPAERLVLWSRTRAWLQHEGYSREINKDCLVKFTTDPAGRFAIWHFKIPTGMGKQAAFVFQFSLAEGKNASKLFVKRYSSGKDDVKAPLRIVFRPDVEWRSFHATTKAQGATEAAFGRAEAVKFTEKGFEFSPHGNNEKFSLDIENGVYHHEPLWTYCVGHPEEVERGQDPSGDLYSPGWISCDLDVGEDVSLIGSYEKTDVSAMVLKGSTLKFAEEITASEALKSETRVDTLGIEEAMHQALELFIVKRDELKTVIAGYPWFLDWGRDTLIFLRGAIAAGRYEESLAILTAFARFEENGTIPNIIYGNTAGNRDTSDAPLFLITGTADLAAVMGREILDTDCTPLGATGKKRRTLAQVLESIAVHFMNGTPNGIRMDAASGLIWSPNHFTWMDTNYPAGTPRIGYPVEIQALWIAGLRFLGAEVNPVWSEIAERASVSLLKYFALPNGGLADCLRARNGESAAEAEQEDAIRPNQLFVLALDALPKSGGKDVGEQAVLEASIVEACEKLLIPGGVRSVADEKTKCDFSLYDNGRKLIEPNYPYHGAYTGDEDTSRKPAYHNGTVWAWPFPMYAEALVKRGIASKETALSLLASAIENLNTGCLCHISEIADGDAPHAQKGCRAQAWSASELLRVWKLLSSM